MTRGLTILQLTASLVKKSIYTIADGEYFETIISALEASNNPLYRSSKTPNQVIANVNNVPSIDSAQDLINQLNNEMESEGEIDEVEEENEIYKSLLDL